MGGHYYISEIARKNLLNQILNENYKYIISLIGTKKETKEEIEGGYKLFKDYDGKKIKEYADLEAEKNNMNLTKIKVYSLEFKLSEELPHNFSVKK